MVRNGMIAIALGILLTTPLVGAPKRDFQTGKLIDVTTGERFVEGTSIVRAVFVVQIGDLVYTARGERVHHHTGDVGEGLIVGDPVQAAVDGDNLILLKPDGKELKTKIIRRERAQ